MEPALNLHIERLVLYGVAPKERRRVKAALQAELSRLLTEQGVPAGLGGGGALARLKINAPSVEAGARAEVVGVQIAQAVYGGLALQELSSPAPAADNFAQLDTTSPQQVLRKDTGNP